MESQRRMDEIFQMLKIEELKHQQAIEELSQSQEVLEAISAEKAQLEFRCHDLTKVINIVESTMEEQKAVFKAKYDSLYEELKATQTEFGMKQLADLEKYIERDEDLQQIIRALETTVIEQRVIIERQRQTYEHMCEQFSKTLLEQHSKGPSKKTHKLLESEVQTLKNGKLRVEEQLCKERDESAAKIKALTDQLDSAKLQVEEQLSKERDENAAKIKALTDQLDSAKHHELKASGDHETNNNLQIVISGPNWDDLETLTGIYVTYDSPLKISEILKDLPLKRNESEPVKIKVSNKPFSQGTERVSYYGREIHGDNSFKDIVLKEYTGFVENVAMQLKTSHQTEVIASLLAKLFCDECCYKADTNVSVDFLQTKFLEIKNDDGTGRFMTCYDRFSSEDNFFHFYDDDFKIMKEQVEDNGLSIEYIGLLMTFSHWTYKITEGNLMVVSSQGVVIKAEKGVERDFFMVNPAIHCVDPSRFGSSNLSTNGMDAFLKGHVCNKFCESLGLTD